MMDFVETEVTYLKIRMFYNYLIDKEAISKNRKCKGELECILRRVLGELMIN